MDGELLTTASEQRRPGQLKWLSFSKLRNPQNGHASLGVSIEIILKDILGL